MAVVLLQAYCVQPNTGMEAEYRDVATGLFSLTTCNLRRLQK